MFLLTGTVLEDYSFWSSSMSELVRVFLLFDGFIYDLLSDLFRLVIEVSSIDFSMGDIVNNIIQRIYIIIGVLALFLVSYGLIKALFDPSKAAKDKSSAFNIVKNMVISIVLVTLMPTIFQYAYRLQNIIIDSNVIGSIVLGKSAGVSTLVSKREGEAEKKFTYSVEDIGYKNYVKITSNKIAFTALNSFLYSDEENKDISDEIAKTNFIGSTLVPEVSKTAAVGGCIFAISNMGVNLGADVLCAQGFATEAMKITEMVTFIKAGSNGLKTFSEYKNFIIVSGDFSYINIFAVAVCQPETTIHYQFGLSTICGIFLLIMMLSFCIQVVIRAFKFVLLEVISPLAVFSRIIPNSKIFDTWLKEVFKTYLELFFRLFLFNFMILLFSSLQSVFDQYSQMTSGLALLNLFVIIGLVIFLNEAPKMVRDILGIKKDDKSVWKRFGEATAPARKAISNTGKAARAVTGAALGAGLGVSRALNDKTPGLSKGKKATNALWYGALGGNKGFKTGKSSKNGLDMFEGVGNDTQKYDAKRRYGNRKWLQAGGNSKGFVNNLADDVGNYLTGNVPGGRLGEYNKQEEKVNNIKKNYEKLDDVAKKNDSRYKIACDNVEKIESTQIKNREQYLNTKRAEVDSEINRMESKHTLTAPELVNYTSLTEKRSNGIALTAQEQRTLAAFQSRIAYSPTDDARHQKLIAYRDDLQSNKSVQDDAWNNYNVDYESRLTSAKQEKKAAKCNYVISQLNTAFDVNNPKPNEVSQIIVGMNNDIEKEHNVGNKFVSSLHTITYDPAHPTDVMKEMSDMMDDTFGKDVITPSQTTVASRNFARNYGSVEREIFTVEADNSKAIYDQTTNSYVLGNNACPYFNAIKSVTNITPTTTTVNGRKITYIDTGTHQYDDQALYDVGKACATLIKNGQNYNTIPAREKAIIDEICATFNINPLNFIADFNKGLRVNGGRNSSTGSIDTFKLTDTDYQQAIEDARRAVEKDKS